MNRKRNFERQSKRKIVLVIGAIIFAFSIIGFYNVSSFVYKGFSDIVTGKNKITQYEQFIAPVVLLDIVPFESVDKLDEKIRLQVGIWSIIINKNTKDYKTDDNGQILIPAVDIEAECSTIFGPDQKFTHESFADYQSQFYYDESTQSYKIPITGRIGYVPQIAKIEKVDDLLRLTVNYIPPQTWTGDNKGNKVEPSADKTLYYFLDKQNNKEYITKIEMIQ